MSTVIVNAGSDPIAPQAGEALLVSPSATSIALPTNSGSTPPATRAVITSLSNSGHDCFIMLGDSSVSVAPGMGLAVRPNSSVEVAIEDNTYLAAVTATGSAILQITTGA